MSTAPKWVNDAIEKLAVSMTRRVKVVDTEYINPQLKKIRFQGDFRKLDFKLGYSILFRVNSTETRHYTTSFADTEQGVMELIAHLHGDAPGSNYMKQLKPGDEIKMAVPAGQEHYDPNVKKQLVFGDETSLSLMVDFLPVLQQNGHQFQFYIELDEENKAIPKILGLENYTVFSKQDVFRSKEKIRELSLFKNDEWQNANVILTGNITSLQNFREILKDKRHQRKIFVKGFWLEGKKGL